MEVKLETSAKLRRPFDAMHFLLTPFGDAPPQAGTSLPPAPAPATEARKSGAGA